jgi:hypothetical protein
VFYLLLIFFDHSKKFVNQAFQNSAAAGPNHVAGLAVAKTMNATKKKKAKMLDDAFPTAAYDTDSPSEDEGQQPHVAALAIAMEPIPIFSRITCS